MKPRVASHHLFLHHHVFVESLAEIDTRKVVEVVRRTRHKNNASATHFFPLCPKPIVRFRWKRARLSLFRPQPRLPSFIQIIKFPRFISENDLPDRYNIRRDRIADNEWNFLIDQILSVEILNSYTNYSVCQKITDFFEELHHFKLLLCTLYSV